MKVRHTFAKVKFSEVGLGKGEGCLDAHEVLGIVEWPLEKAIEKISDGMIQDAKTMIGLQMVWLGVKD